MIESQTPSRLERIAEEIRAFRAERRSLHLATLGSDGMPHASYAPFALDEQGYYILISELAQHTQNLLANPRASLLLSDDEQDTREMLARRRLTFNATAVELKHGSAAWDQGIACLRARLGERIESLAAMADFHLFRLEPSNGLFVKGFGQAYRLPSHDLGEILHIRGDGQGHGHTKAHGHPHDARAGHPHGVRGEKPAGHPTTA